MKTTEATPEKFDKAVRATERAIAKLAKNEVEETVVRRAIDRLYDMSTGLMNDGLNVAPGGRFEQISALIKAKVAANEAAYHARVAARNEELARLRQEIRDAQPTAYANFRNGRPVRIDG